MEEHIVAQSQQLATASHAGTDQGVQLVRMTRANQRRMALEPYKKYGILYKERKLARSFRKQKQTLSFTNDLPAEVRLAVYRHLFNAPNKFLELRVEIPKIRPPATNSYPFLAAHMGALVCMMCVCKKIRGEVAEYFYGGNNFRFSQRFGIVVMSCFFHTVGTFNCNFLRHITVHLPNRSVSPGGRWYRSREGWLKLQGMLSLQGLEIPGYKSQSRSGVEDWRFGEVCYDADVRRVFRRLRNMPHLKRLDITIPAYYDFLKFDPRTHVYCCVCKGVDIEAMSHADRTRHIIRDHSTDSEYWDLLADLKANAASEDLTIALVMHYEAVEYVGVDEWMVGRRKGPWIAAYAALMGYELGHARWEVEGQDTSETYMIRYETHPLLRRPPRVMGKSFREVSELPAPVSQVSGDVL